MEVDFCSFQIKMALNFNPKGRTEKFELFSQGTYDSQNFRYETRIIANYKYVKISRAAVTDIKLWMKEDLDYTQITFEVNSNSSSESARVMQDIFFL